MVLPQKRVLDVASSSNSATFFRLPRGTSTTFLYRSSPLPLIYYSQESPSSCIGWWNLLPSTVLTYDFVWAYLDGGVQWTYHKSQYQCQSQCDFKLIHFFEEESKITICVSNHYRHFILILSFSEIEVVSNVCQWKLCYPSQQ